MVHALILLPIQIVLHADGQIQVGHAPEILRLVRLVDFGPDLRIAALIWMVLLRQAAIVLSQHLHHRVVLLLREPRQMGENRIPVVGRQVFRQRHATRMQAQLAPQIVQPVEFFLTVLLAELADNRIDLGQQLLMLDTLSYRRFAHHAIYSYEGQV